MTITVKQNGGNTEHLQAAGLHHYLANVHNLNQLGGVSQRTCHPLELNSNVRTGATYPILIFYTSPHLTSTFHCVHIHQQHQINNGY